MPIRSIADIPETVSEQDIRAATAKRRFLVSKKWETGGLKQGDIVMIPSGDEIIKPGADIPYPYDAHAEFSYLVGQGARRQVLVFDPSEGWTLFVHVQTEKENVWEGPIDGPEEIQEKTGIESVKDLKELQPWLRKHKGCRLAMLGNEDILEKPAAYEIEDTTPSPVMLQEKFGLNPHAPFRDNLRQILNLERLVKDPVELSLMMGAVNITRNIFHDWMKMVLIGKTDASIRAFFEAEIASYGVRPAYQSIVGVGRDAAVLHFFKPSGRAATQKDTILVDAAASSRGYMSDVTRVIPAGKKFTPEQRDLYQVVLDAQVAAIADSRAGAEWRDHVHRNTVSKLAQGLVDMGILYGPTESRVEDGSLERFLAHGVGHTIGIDVHDMGRYRAPGRNPDMEKPGGRTCSVDFPLEAGVAVTVEPGLYFPTWLLGREDFRRQFAQVVNWSKLDPLLENGRMGYGVRIEDDIVVTKEGEPIVLTKYIPKQIKDIEEMRP